MKRRKKEGKPGEKKTERKKIDISIRLFQFNLKKIDLKKNYEYRSYISEYGGGVVSGCFFVYDIFRVSVIHFITVNFTLLGASRKKIRNLKESGWEEEGEFEFSYG